VVVPATRLSTISDRGSPVAAARAWNALQQDVASASFLSFFRRQLKTRLFCDTKTFSVLFSHCNAVSKRFRLYHAKYYRNDADGFREMSSTDALQDASILADAHEKPCVLVPIVQATAESLVGYGSLVSDFDAEDIVRVTWPKSRGWRQIVPGTGNLQVALTHISEVFCK